MSAGRPAATRPAASTSSCWSPRSWPFIVLGFVVFFYCLGALYDERKDRSVLFWKSLPLSDRDTVLSKAAERAGRRPGDRHRRRRSPRCSPSCWSISARRARSTAATRSRCCGARAARSTWPAHLVAAIPVYALWALPTVGWLMLCSAWARSKPFLWAVMIPVFAGIFVAWFDMMNIFNLDTGWFWQHIVARSLTSVVPGHVDDGAGPRTIYNGPDRLRRAAQPAAARTRCSPRRRCGSARSAGIAMIVGAIRLRRWRDDN